MQRQAQSKKPLLILAIVIVIALIVGGGLMWKKRQNTPERKVQEVVDKIGKLMALPSGSPTVFNIEDPEKLVGQQAFFKGSEKGDQLVVFSESAKAIIYSPSRNIIVNAGPVTFDTDPNATASPSPTATPKQ